MIVNKFSFLTKSTEKNKYTAPIPLQTEIIYFTIDDNRQGKHSNIYLFMYECMLDRHLNRTQKAIKNIHNIRL